MKIAVVVAACMLAGGPLSAQRAAVSLTPYAGLFADDTSARAMSFGRAGPLFGTRIALPPDGRLSVVADVAYATINRVGISGTLAQYVVYGRDHLLITAGAEYRLIGGRIAAGLELAAGGDWIREDPEERIGNPPPEFVPSGSFHFNPIVAPGAWADVQLGDRTALRLTIRDHVLVDGGRQNLALAAGVRFAAGR